MMRALGAALLMAFANAWALPHAHAADSAKPGQSAYRISDGVVRIGVITDMSAVYKDLSGVGSVLAARMAIEDFGGSIAGFPIELLDADHHNEADRAAGSPAIGSSAARSTWWSTCPTAPRPSR